ncbi:hypothetical protein ACIA8O_38680 [Kitasatospora sp. NPDC051853]|uniref:hypothetical protein n=1 Tax=Kitasatospora sp. NPDC051853 TaxID=3364058 RepID=UPI0037A69445
MPRTGLGATVLTPVLGALAGAPWTVIIIALALVLVFFALQTLIPQDSKDRLAWWQDRRAHTVRRRRDRELRRTRRRQDRLERRRKKADPTPLPQAAAPALAESAARGEVR